MYTYDSFALILQYVEGDMMKLQQIMFEGIADEHKWMGFMYEVTHVIGSGEYRFIYKKSGICN